MANWSSSWVVLQWATGALVIALLLPFLVPRGRRAAGGAARVTLALAAGFALASAGAATSELDGPGRVLLLGAVLALLCGLIAIARLMLFDLFLPAAGVFVPTLVSDVIQIALSAVSVLICLRYAGFDLLPLITTSAVLTAVIGLALQGPIANLFGGVALQLDRTLGEGDWIETGKHGGRIAEINWRSTRIVTREGDTLFLPNSQLLSGEVLNLSRPTGAHRATVRIAVDDANPPGTVRQLLVEAIRDVPGVLEFPPPDAIVADFGDAAVVYEMRFWMTEFERDAAIASEVRSRAWYATRRAGMVLARSPKREELAWMQAQTTRATENDQRHALLREVELLAPLDDEGRSRLAAHMEKLEFAAGEPIFHQGSPGDRLYIVDRGEVGVRLQVSGTNAEIARCTHGELFGEMALLSGEPRAATCIARTEVTCYAVDRAGFEEVVAANPEIAEHLSRILARRRADLEVQLSGLPVAARARFEEEERSRFLRRIRDLFRT